MKWENKEYMGRVENSEVVDLHLIIGIITIVNGFNTPVKQQRLSHWIKKSNISICCL